MLVNKTLSQGIPYPYHVSFPLSGHLSDEDSYHCVVLCSPIAKEDILETVGCFGATGGSCSSGSGLSAIRSRGVVGDGYRVTVLYVNSYNGQLGRYMLVTFIKTDYFSTSLLYVCNS